MPRARKKSKSEPATVAEVLESSPVASVVGQAKTPEPARTEDPVAAFEKQRAREQAATDSANVEDEADRQKTKPERQELHFP